MSYSYFWIIALVNIQNCVMGEEDCGERNVTGAVGGAVTLLIGYPGVRSISWSFDRDKGTFATTSPGGQTIVLEVQYEGRLRSTSDGSLIITNLTQGDQGTFRAKFRSDIQSCIYHLSVFSKLTAEDITINFDATDNKMCEVNLTCSVNKSNVDITWSSLSTNDIDVTQNVVSVPPSHITFTYVCTAQNPVSKASRTVHPLEYCRRELDTMRNVDYTLMNLIRLAISGCLLLTSCCILIYHLKTEVVNQRPKRDGM